MLSKGAVTITRIFSVLFVVCLLSLRLNTENFCKESEACDLLHCGCYSVCRRASILSAGRNHQNEGGSERFGGWQGREVAGARDVQGPLWSISRIRSRIMEILEGYTDVPLRSRVRVYAVPGYAWRGSNRAKQGKKPLKRSFRGHFEVTSCPFKILNFMVAKVFTSLQWVKHFLPKRKKYLVSDARSNVAATMECISTTEVYCQAQAKEEWVLAADQVFISGLGGSENDMYRQLLHIIERTGLPIDKDAARSAFERRNAIRTDERGLKNAKDHFATQKQASFIIPLERPCRFSSNPLVTKNGCSEDEVFSVIHSINDPEVEATRGFKYQRYVVQPWIPRTDETIIAGSLIITSWNDMQSLNDCYVTIYDELVGRSNALIPPEVYQRVQFAACRLRCEQGSGSGGNTKKNAKKSSHASWRPWGFKLLVACSEYQFSDALVLQNALQSLSSDEGRAISIKGIKMFFLSGLEPVTASLEREVNRVQQDPWVILNGTYAPKLTFMLRTLCSVGVRMDDVLSISHTCSYGQPGLHMMEHNHNVLVRFKRLGAAIQLAQWWNDLDISRRISQLGRVMVIYGYDQAPLRNQILEPKLHSPGVADVVLASSKPDSNDGSDIKSGNTQKHALRNGKTYSQAAKPSVKRTAQEMECETLKSDSAILRRVSTETLQATVGAACRELPMNTYATMGKELCSWLEEISLSQIGPDKDKMEKYKVLSEVAEAFRSGAFISALSAFQEGADMAVESEDMEVVHSNGVIGALGTGSIGSRSGVCVPIDHDEERSLFTPSDGACGYATICLVIKYDRGELSTLCPLQYKDNMKRLAADLRTLACLPGMKELPDIRAKIARVAAVLRKPNWNQILTNKRDMWLTVADVTEVLRTFDVPCCEWMWTRDGYKCFFNRLKPDYDFCYHMMLYKGHFYLHSRTDVIQISPRDACAKPIPWLLKGGSIYVPCEGGAEEVLDVWLLMADHALQRSPHFCGIYPAMAEVSEYEKMRLRRGDGRADEILNYSTTERVDRELMKFYWDHRGGNQWATVSQHRAFGITLDCTTSARFIPKGTNIAPVVGTITTEPGSFSAIPCNGIYEEFEGMNVYIDPTPVGFDAGYNTYMDPVELWERRKLELNLSRYVRIAWSSTLDIIPNAEFVYTPGKATIWIRALVDISPDEIIWVAPPPNMRYGMNPVSMFWNPPLPSFSQACYFPKYWEYIVVECLPLYPEQPIKPEQCLSVNCANLPEISDGLLVGSAVGTTGGEFHGLWVGMSLAGCNDQVSIDFNYWSRIFRNELSLPLVSDNLIQRFVDYMIELLVLLVSLLEDEVSLLCSFIVFDLYCWSAAQCFGVEFSSDNAGDGPKRSFSQMDNRLMNDQTGAIAWTGSLEISECGDADKEIRIACWNSNGHLISNDSLTMVDLIQQLQLDILMISDSRLTKRASGYHFKVMKQVLKGYSMIAHSTTRSSFTRGGGARMNTMGGTLFIISPRCSTNIVDTGDDGSGLGIAGYVRAIIGGVKYCMISVYQPIGGDEVGESTILSRLQAFLHKNRIQDNPRTYILNVVSKWVASSRQKGFIPILGGDFNMDPKASNGSKLRLWSEENNLVNVLARAISAPYFTHMKKGQGVSCIDHIFTDPQLWQRILRARVIQRPQLTAMSDHRVIYMALAWQNGTSHAKTAEHLPSIKRVELRHYDSDMMHTYQTEMDVWAAENNFEELDPSEGLAMVMRKSVDVTKELSSRTHDLSQQTGFRSSFKNGYSPCFLALKSAYLLILHYHQQLVSATRRSQRYRDSLHCAFIKLSHKWLREFPFSDFSHDEVLARVHDTAYTALCNIRLLPHVTVDDLFTRAMGVRRLLHGRLRSEFRKRMSDKIKLMENMRQQGRLSYMFRMVNLREKQSVDLSVISKGGSLFTNPDEIHDELTAHFSEWYRVPRHLHAVAQDIYYGQAWHLLLDGNYTALQGPDSFRLEEFRVACQYKVSPELRHDFRGSLLRPISVDEYAAEVAKIKYGKAPGPSGATATMIKAWPEKIHEQVLRWINDIWESKRVPQWWLYAHLRPIPKSGEATLDNLRPLGLYEITRKILTAIVTRRIYNLWEGHGLLDGAQHAFRRGRSTSQAIIRLVNTVEDSTERNIPQRMVQWDLRRAFDSVSFNFVRLALLRMGVPQEIVSFLTEMMEHNVMTVASPYHMRNHLLSGGVCKDAVFHQERGTGQGDPPSPLIWIAVFDILLSMLHATPSDGSLYVQGQAGMVYAAHDIAYADDLATISSSLHHQQGKADLVCTFCACTGMQIALAKVESFAINCPESCSKLVLHDSSWTAHILTPTTGKLALKYLGFETDHIGGDLSAYSVTLTFLQMAASHLIHCHASRETKLLVYRMQIVPKVLYMATKACWTLEQYRRLDRYAAMILKHVGHQMQTSANSMMFFPADMCGSGLHPISDLAQAQKWGELARTLDMSGETSWAAHGTLERALRQTVQQAPATQFRTLDNRNASYLKCFAGSLVEWGGEIGCYLSHTPAYEHMDGNKAILPYLGDGPEEEELIIQLQRKDITVQGELVRRSFNGEVKWETDSTTMLARRLLGEYLNETPADEGIVLNNGQLYRLQNNVIEIIGRIADTSDVLCYRWMELQGSSDIIIRSLLHDTSTVVIPYLDIATSEQIERIITLPMRGSCRTSGMLVRRITSMTMCPPPSLGVSRIFSLPRYIQDFVEQVECLSQEYHCAYTLFTDGSHIVAELLLQEILAPGSGHGVRAASTAAIVAMATGDNWRDLPCLVLYFDVDYSGITGMRAGYAELLALLVAAHIQDGIPSTAIYSDCQGAMKLVDAVVKGSRKPGVCKIRPIVSTLCVLNARPNISWVPSHPERTKQQSFWSYYDWGIFLADLAAGRQISQLQSYVNATITRIPMADVMRDLIMPNQWFWSVGRADVPMLSSPIHLHARNRVEQYLETRDKYRENSGEGAIWEGTALGLANKCWKSAVKGILGCNQILKNVLDKYWHGRNRAKGLSGAAAIEAAQCLFCGMADSQTHIFLQCPLEELCVLRMRAKDELQSTAEDIVRGLSDDKIYERRVVRYIVLNAFNLSLTHVNRLWLGSWNATILACALRFESESCELPYALHYEVAMNIQRVIIRLTEPLIKAVADMMRVRCSTKPSAINDMNDLPPRKRNRCGHASYENVVMQAVFAKPKTIKAQRQRKRVGTVCRPSRRQERIRRKRGVSVAQDEDHEDSSVAMDIVGYVSHPQGETQSLDYDRD